MGVVVLVSAEPDAFFWPGVVVAATDDTGTGSGTVYGVLSTTVIADDDASGRDGCCTVDEVTTAWVVRLFVPGTDKLGAVGSAPTARNRVDPGGYGSESSTPPCTVESGRGGKREERWGIRFRWS